MIKKANRFEFLDFLRFLAAFSVIIQHVFEKLSPAFKDFSTNYFQFGTFGVVIFFLTSGFVIPVSLEKHKSLKAFWIGRLYRLFPLYIFSIILQLTLIKLDYTDAELPSITALFANIIMLAKFTGQPLIEGLYWTLNVEMVFYILVSVLFVLKQLSKTLLLAFAAMGIALLLGGFAIGYLQLASSGWGLILSIATMFTGTVFYRYIKEEISFKQLFAIVTFAFITILTITYLNLYNKPQSDLTFWSGTNGYIFAYIVFIIFFCLRSLQYPKPLLFMGLISYSLYLMQAAVMPVVFSLLNDIVIGSTVCITCIIIVSWITYKYIENPFIKMGKNKMAKFEPVSRD